MSKMEFKALLLNSWLGSLFLLFVNISAAELLTNPMQHNFLKLCSIYIYLTDLHTQIQNQHNSKPLKTVLKFKAHQKE